MSRSGVRKCQYGSREILNDSRRSNQGDHAYRKVEYNADGNDQSYSENLDPPCGRHYLDSGLLALQVPNISMLLLCSGKPSIPVVGLDIWRWYSAVFLQLGDRSP